MMTVKLQITILIALAVALAAIINMIRRKSLELKYALYWRQWRFLRRFRRP